MAASPGGRQLTRLQEPHTLLPKLFGELRERYGQRPGGYTRVLRTEPHNTYDQGESAILELVDGPRDVRFAMTAMAVARDQTAGKTSTDVTELNVKKVTRYRRDGQDAFDGLVERMKKRLENLSLGGR